MAVCTNGTRVLGLGDIGPVASMPVMEGKALIFRQMAGISAMPILIDSDDVDTFVDTVLRIAPGFGAIVSASFAKEPSSRVRVCPVISPG